MADHNNGQVGVAVVGMAAVFPGASDLATYWQNILDGVDAITDAPASRWDPSYYDPEAAATRRSDRFYCRRGGFVASATFDPTRFGIMPVAVEGVDPDQLIALHVAAEAIADAGGEDRLGDRSRVGVIVGRGGYLNPAMLRLTERVRTANQLVATLRELLPAVDEAQLAAIRSAFQARLGPERPESSIDVAPNLVASRVANRLDLAGPAYTVDAACASSLVAVDHAVRELATGRCDAVVAGGVHHCHDLTLWSIFSQLGALSRSQRIRPFHRGADGLLMGEGTGMVVLKRLADAAGDRVYAVIRGAGVASDGHATSLMSPRADGQVLAIERAWQAAGLDPTEPAAIGLLEAHGTATPAGDQTELASLNRVFGSASGGRERAEIGIGSVKSMIGHAMPAAGIAGLIKAVLAVHHGVAPPTLHCDDPHPALAGSRFRPVTQTEPWPTAARTPRRAGVNAFGFGGINAHVILEEQPGAARVSRRPKMALPVGPERVLLLAGATPDELASQLRETDTTLLSRDDAHAEPQEGHCRLAIVAPTPRRLELARRIVAQGKPWRGRTDVWLSAMPLLGGPPGPARIAFVFPGLEQTFEPRVDDVADHFGLARPDLADPAGLGRHILGVAAVGRLLDAALREIGIVPDVIAGHSIGEWNAMAAAGCIPQAAVQEFTDSFDPDTIRVADVVFAALGCGAELAAATIDEFDGAERVVVSHDNCPHQSIICGEEAAVAAVLDRLRARGVTGNVLPIRHGVHSPMFAPYLEPARASFDRLPLRRAVVPLWSAATVAPYPDDPDAIRELAVRHLVEPVRFGPLVRRLYDEGVQVFVQVGTGSLTGFIDDTLGEHGQDHGRGHLAVSANTPKRSGLDQLRRVAAALWVEGATPRFDRLPTASGLAPPPTSGHTIRLNLGAPLVRLGDAIRPLTDAPAATGLAEGVRRRANGHPVLAEFGAVLEEATTAARDVLGSWAADTAHTHRMQATTTRVLSLETMPYLADHCLFRQPPGWPELSDRFPVVPIATTIELMIQAARDLVPDRTVVGVQHVRALRWLTAVPPLKVTITASLDAGGNVAVTIEDYARGTVVLADGYPPPPNIPDRPLAGERPCEITAEMLYYTDRWAFHGPRFQGVTELGPVGDDGIRGMLGVLATPGALLDSVAQLFGLWIGTQRSEDRIVFPVGIEGTRCYGPDPPPGDRVSCVVRISSVTATDVVGDIELRIDGQLWARIDGWRERRFSTDEVTWPVFRFPEQNRIAEAGPCGVFLVQDRGQDPASLELLMRRYLGAAERTEYGRRRNPRAARQWLWGRIAVKDAVRQWLWDRGSGPLFPVEIAVTNGELGRPLVRGPFDESLQVSLAHSGPLAAAIVGLPIPGACGPGVGIDIEMVTDRDVRTEATILTEAERRLLDAQCSSTDATRSSWLTRFWTAKEAVAKAEGTGLGGRPKRFVVERIDGDRLLVRIRNDLGRDEITRWVHTRLGEGPAPYALAWTRHEDA